MLELELKKTKSIKEKLDSSYTEDYPVREYDRGTSKVKAHTRSEEKKSESQKNISIITKDEYKAMENIVKILQVDKRDTSARYLSFLIKKIKKAERDIELVYLKQKGINQVYMNSLDKFLQKETIKQWLKKGADLEFLKEWNKNYIENTKNRGYPR